MPALEDSEAAVVAEINGAGFQIPTDAEFADFQTAFGWGDHSTAGYLTNAAAFATAAQGALADTALQPGANISTLTNDAGFLTSAPVASVAGLTGTVSSGALVTALGLDIGTDVQAYDANLPTWPATVSATEVGYLDGVTSGIQAQIDALVSGGGGDMLSTNNLSDLANAATARSNLGVAIGSDVQAYDANLPTWPAAVSATELGFLDGVTSNIQAQIDGIGGGGSGDAWGDPVDANITFAANNTYTIGTDAARAAGGHFETLSVAGQTVTVLADPGQDAIGFYDQSAGQEGYLTTFTGLTITGTALVADVLSVAGETGVITAAALRTALNVEDGAQANPDEVVLMVVRNSGEDMVTGDGQQTFRVPATLNGMNLVGVVAYQTTAGVTGLTTYQVRNATQAVDMLSTPITIDSGETTSDTAAAAPVIDAANDDVATGDIIEIDIDTVATGTAPQGGRVELIFRAP